MNITHNLNFLYVLLKLSGTVLQAWIGTFEDTLQVMYVKSIIT